MNPYVPLVYAFILFGAAVELIVNVLNVRNASPDLPQPFVGFYDGEKYRKSQLYLQENTRASTVENIVTTAVTLLFLYFGGFQMVDEIARQASQNEIVRGLVFVGILGIGMRILSLPFSIHSTFVTEQKYGFNRTTAKTFIADLIKGTVLGAVLGGLVFAGIMWFFLSVGENAWIWVWAALTAFQLILLFLAPAFIMPLFNKFVPLEDGPLKSAIEAYAASQNFMLQGIYKMDGSKRSTKANAYFTGFGKYRRVVLFDTLIEKHTTEELVAILAHEIGHFKHRHIFKQLALSFLTSGVMFFVLSKFLGNVELVQAFGLREASVYASIVFFAFLYAPISTLVSLFSLKLSRQFEFEADHYSATTYGKPSVMATALKKLTVENLGNLTPHPIAVLLRYTHPPVLERLARLGKD